MCSDGVCQVDEGGGGFDGGQDTGAAGDGASIDDDNDDDDAGGVDFGLLMADDANQSQFITSQATDDIADGDGTLLTGDNLLVVPRKVGWLDSGTFYISHCNKKKQIIQSNITMYQI